MSGDARRALDICRRATELAETAGWAKHTTVLVGMSHVDAALQEMYSAPKIVAMRSGSWGFEFVRRDDGGSGGSEKISG